MMAAAVEGSLAEKCTSIGPIEITGAELFRLSIPLREPFRISSGEISNKDALLLRVTSGDFFGWGESSAMSGSFYSSDTPDGCETDLISRLLPSVMGRRFENLPQLDNHLAALSTSGFARVAIETAACELVARRQGVSVRALLDIADRPVPSGLAVGLFDSPEQLIAAIERQKPERYRRLKIKRGHDVELVRIVRKRFPSLPLFVDANADYTLDDLPVFEELDRFGLMMFEQPFGKDDLDGSALAQKKLNTPICMDESIESAESAQKAFDSGSCRIINLKIQRMGGIVQSCRLIDHCVRTNTPLWMGTMPELGVGSAQALTLAAHPAFVLPTDVEPSERWYEDDVLAPELRLSDEGTLAVPRGHGWGFEVDPLKLEKWCVRRSSL